MIYTTLVKCLCVYVYACVLVYPSAHTPSSSYHAPFTCIRDTKRLLYSTSQCGQLLERVYHRLVLVHYCRHGDGGSSCDDDVYAWIVYAGMM